MTHEKALELLELEEGASTQEVRSAYQEFFNELNIRLTNAPTDHQKQLYTRRLQDIEKAFLLLGGMSQDDINEMPSISPVEISEEEQTRQVQENAKTNATITEAQALKMLALKIPFSADMLENTYRKKKRDLEAGMKSAPSAKLKQGYQEEIDKLSQAYTLLLTKAQDKEKKKLPLGIFAAIGVVLLLVGVLAVWQPWKGKDSIDPKIDLVTKEEFIKHKSQGDVLAEKKDWSHALEKYQAAYALIVNAEVSDSIASMENRIATIANDSKAKEAAEAEAKDWKAAQKANTTAAYLDFIKKHPSGTHTSQAEQKIKDLENTYSANIQRAAEEQRSRDQAEDEPEAPIVDYPDQEASFPGGVAAMKKFLAENIKYPEVAMELGDQGKVFVEFVVNKDGSIEQVKVLRGVSREIDREAKRLVRSMPKWTPAENSGESVRARCRIPINFILQ